MSPQKPATQTEPTAVLPFQNASLSFTQSLRQPCVNATVAASPFIVCHQYTESLNVVQD